MVDICRVQHDSYGAQAMRIYASLDYELGIMLLNGNLLNFLW